MDPNEAVVEISEARRAVRRAAGELPLAGVATVRAFDTADRALAALLRQVEREAGAGRLAAA